MSNIIPQNDYILVKPIKVEDVTASGILIRRDEDKPIEKAMVIHPGNSEFKVNDIIGFCHYNLKEIEENGEKLGIIKYQDITLRYT